MLMILMFMKSSSTSLKLLLLAHCMLRSQFPTALSTSRNVSGQTGHMPILLVTSALWLVDYKHLLVKPLQASNSLSFSRQESQFQFSKCMSQTCSGAYYLLRHETFLKRLKLWNPHLWCKAWMFKSHMQKHVSVPLPNPFCWFKKITTAAASKSHVVVCYICC